MFNLEYTQHCFLQLIKWVKTEIVKNISLLIEKK